MRFTKMLGSVVPAAVVVAMLSATGSMGQSEKGMKGDTVKTTAPVKQLKPQTTCPVMGGPIDKKQYVDYKGKRIYVCCPGCIDSVKANPEKYIKKLEMMGQGVETIGEKPKKGSKDVKAGSAMKEMDMKAMKTDTASKAAEAGYWTCPMHPEIHLSKPGQCPICGMDLVYKKIEKNAKETKGMDRDKMKM